MIKKKTLNRTVFINVICRISGRNNGAIKNCGKQGTSHYLIQRCGTKSVRTTAVPEITINYMFYKLPCDSRNISRAFKAKAKSWDFHNLKR